jgi:hypothetical protein
VHSIPIENETRSQPISVLLNSNLIFKSRISCGLFGIVACGSARCERLWRAVDEDVQNSVDTDKRSEKEQIGDRQQPKERLRGSIRDASLTWHPSITTGADTHSTDKNNSVSSLTRDHALALKIVILFGGLRLTVIPTWTTAKFATCDHSVSEKCKDGSGVGTFIS